MYQVIIFNWSYMLAGALLLVGIFIQPAIAEDNKNEGSLVVSVDSSKEYAEGFTIPIMIRVRNTTAVAMDIWEPILGTKFNRSEIQNIDITVEHLDADGLWNALPEVYGFHSTQESLQSVLYTQIAADAEKSFQINLREFFVFPENVSGIFRFEVKVSSRDAGKFVGRCEFRVVERRPISQQTTNIDKPFWFGGDSAIKDVDHSALLFKKNERVALYYGASFPGFPGYILIDEAKHLDGYKIAFANRDVSKENIYYDALNTLHFNSPSFKDMTREEYELLSPMNSVRNCAYVAVAYVKDERMFFWSAGKYLPFPNSFVPELYDSLPRYTHFDILSNAEVLVPDVANILSMKSEQGLMVIEYLDREKQKRTIKVDEKGKLQE
jgi:hypothetical protein